jgi:aspartyl-tRNA(Asn)/glutamyl-tRNA(Gln) amidotransferase subunit B
MTRRLARAELEFRQNVLLVLVHLLCRSMAQRLGRTAFATAPSVSSFLRITVGASQSHGVSGKLVQCARISAGTSRARRGVTVVATGASVETKGTTPDAGQGKKKRKKKGGGEPRARREKKASQSKALISALEKYEPVIGVEVHVQLATKSKAYCSCSTKAVRTPNTNICPICMGHPGALPVLNVRTVQLAAQAAMALNCKVSPASRFDRKNYFYSDTSKNYQITQQYHPIAEFGSLTLASSGKRIGITRLHMEEDSAKMTHEGDVSGGLNESTHSLIDFNRGGIPLAEIVSDPDLRTGVEAAEYGQELQRILRYIRASDCNMQDGSLRLDVNVSIRPKGEEKFGTKVELKNLNSFSAVQRSIEFEIERQAALLDSNQLVSQETRLWDEKVSKTKLMRVKEEAADYRYFPEPDLPPLVLDEETLTKWREALPELPAQKRERFASEYGLSTYDAFLLADDVDFAIYFEAAVNAGGEPKQCANWIMGDITKVLNREKMTIRDCKLTAGNLAELVTMIDEGTISGKIAKDLIIELVIEGGSPGAIVKDR